MVQQPSVVLVDELAGLEDYWLTLTDAARITRRQEVTIRRWVAAGHLPVRRQPMGLTKRTRHVRASDLAQLTPIIDPTAAISDATAHLDLVGIPQQQTHLHIAQQRLTGDVARLIQHVSDVTAQILALDNQLRAHNAQHLVVERRTQDIVHDLAQQREAIEVHLAKQHAQVETALATLAALQAQATHLAEQERVLASTVATVVARVDAHHQRMEGMDTIERTLEHVLREQAALREQLTQQAAQGGTFAERLATLEAVLTPLREQHHSDTQQLHELTTRADRAAVWQETCERVRARDEARHTAQEHAQEHAQVQQLAALGALAARVAEMEHEQKRLVQRVRVGLRLHRCRPRSSGTVS